MRLFRLLVLRSFLARPLRMLLSTFGIVLGVATILAIGVTNQAALKSIDRLFESASGKANLIVTSVENDGRGFSQNILSRLRTQPGIATIVPSIQLQTALADEATPTETGLSFFGQSAGGLVLYGIDPQLDDQVREYRIVEGNPLSDSMKSDEIVLVDSYVEKNELELGKTLEIVTPSGIQELELVGIMAKEGPGQLNNGAFGIIPLETAQKLSYREGMIDQVDLVVTPERSPNQAIENTRISLQDYLGEGYSVIYPAAQGRRMTQMLSNFQIGLNFMSGMALFVGAFLIYNAFAMTVAERTREFGMLRTVGMSRQYITAQVLGEALLLGIFGSGLGLVLGLLMASGLSRIMGALLAQDVAGIQVPSGLAITAMLVGIFVALLAALIPALNAGRVSPIEALLVRGRSQESKLLNYSWIPGLAVLLICTFILILDPFPYDIQFRLGSLVTFGFFLGAALIIPATIRFWERGLRPIAVLLYRQSGRLGSSNISRAKMRTTLTVAALMIGVAMVVIVWAITGSFKGDLDEWLSSYAGGDLYVSSSLPMGTDVWKRLQGVEGVEAITPLHYFNVRWIAPTGDEEIVFMAIDPASYTRVTSFQFSQDDPEPQISIQQLSNGNAVFISSVLSEKYGFQPGDEITIKTKTGPHQFTIAGVTVNYFNQGLVIIGNWNDMDRYFREKGANAFQIKVQQGLSPDQVGDLIDVEYGERDRLVIESSQSLLRRISSLMKQAFSMFDVLALIAILVGFFGIANTLTMNVIERTQEIGMLRGVGMTRFQVVRMILAESGMIGLVGGFMGMVLGVVLSRIFMAAMMAMSGYRLTFLLPASRLILAILAALVISQLAALLPAIRAARIRILDAIHYE